MINTKIIFLSLLKDVTRIDEINFPLNDKSTIKNLLEKLTNKFGKIFEKSIFDNSGNLSKYIIIVLNGKDIRSFKGLDTTVQNNDEILFLPAIAGG